MTQFTAAQKAKEARREAHMRERVYDQRIKQSLMPPDEAAHKIALMMEIADDYDELAKKERLL